MHESVPATADSGFDERIRVAGDPVADPAAQVRVGHARFTVLTARLLRLEWTPAGEFEDRGTYAFPNRRADVPPFEVREERGTTVVDTGALVLEYIPDGRPFHPGNLSVELTGHPRTRWVPGALDLDNLGGGRRTIDECRGEAALEPGLVSRSGWAVFDDSLGVLFTQDGSWVEARPEYEDLQDWYFFGYGHDYAAAVSEYTRFGGPVPLVPRWVLGAWWSKYWPYSDADLRALVAEFRARGLPLDLVVLDMDWHRPDSWTGYSWNRELFPDPRGFLAWLHEQNLHTTLNLHPALGVQSFEDAYPAFAEAIGLHPDSGEPIPFRIADRAFVRNYFALLHHPLEDEGVDFWWMDWQQGRTSELRGLDPLPWLNHLHFADASRRADRRPLVFSRWGGLGSHRYPIGFSGDSFSQWSALRFQPRLTAAGANVGYGWWSHDIGGHAGRPDPELYLRWVQFGALSPVLRLHSNQDPDSERLPWAFGEEILAATRKAFRLRYQLVPYLYTAARVAADTGVAIVRPTAWVAPEHDGAYVARYQYLLGDALLVAPVMHPREPSTGLATVDVWLPEGDWVERTTGESFTGPRWVRLVADLTRIPQFVRPGTVLPLAEVAPTTTDQPDDHLILSVVPGASGRTRVYDDDGTSLAHRSGAFSWTPVTTETPDPSRCAVTVWPADGDSGDALRRYTVRVEGTRRPAQVTVDGTPHDAWRHDPESATAVVEVPYRRRHQRMEVTLTADGPLSARGPEHDCAVRAADLRRLLGEDRLDEERLEDAVRALPAEHPSRAAAVARIGGPAVQVLEYTAPDEATAQLGRLVVAAPEHAPAAQVSATWTLDRGGVVTTVDTGPLEVTGDALVLAAPFRWDGSLTPARWEVHVTVTWGELELATRHQSAVLVPALPAWRVALVDAGDERPARDVVADLTDPSPSLGWMRWQADPAHTDFRALTERTAVPFRSAAAHRPRAALTAYAVTAVTVREERDVAFDYLAGGPVRVAVDGVPVEAATTGADPMPYYALHPTSRRTAPVRLSAGTHTVLFACGKTPEMLVHDWYVSVSAVDPDDGRVLLDVIATVPPVPRVPASAERDLPPR